MGTQFRIQPSASVWKTRADAHNIWATKSIEVMQRKCDLGIKIAAVSLHVLDTYAWRLIEFDIEQITGGFPVVEQRLLISGGRPWYAYIAMAENKTLLAEVVEFASRSASRNSVRQDSLERAAKWIRGCDRWREHGRPVLVDSRGRPL